jgi:hypothetical protein
MSSSAEQCSSDELHIGQSPGANVGSKACDPSPEWIILRQIRDGKSQVLLATQNSFLARFYSPHARHAGVRMICVPRNPFIRERQIGSIVVRSD